MSATKGSSTWSPLKAEVRALGSLKAGLLPLQAGEEDMIGQRLTRIELSTKEVEARHGGSLYAGLLPL
jgi:hypothetical protein